MRLDPQWLALPYRYKDNLNIFLVTKPTPATDQYMCIVVVKYKRKGVKKKNLKEKQNKRIYSIQSIIEHTTYLTNLSSVRYLPLVGRLSNKKSIYVSGINKYNDTKSKTPQQAVC